MAPVSVGISNRIHHPQIDHCWLVVSTPLKNINQLGLLLPIYGKMFQTTTLFTTLFRAALVKRKQPDFRGVSVSVPAGQGTDKPLQTTETRLPNSRR